MKMKKVLMPRCCFTCLGWGHEPNCKMKEIHGQGGIFAWETCEYWIMDTVFKGHVELEEKSTNEEDKA